MPGGGRRRAAGRAAARRRLCVAGRAQPGPAGVLAATRLARLDLRDSGFELLPAGISALAGLEALHLGRRPAAPGQNGGGALDARALGALARFPRLAELGFDSCSVLFGPELAAAHARLRCLELDAAYPAPGASGAAFMEFALALLRRGRGGVLRVPGAVQGAGQQGSQGFDGALHTIGYELGDDDDGDGDDAEGEGEGGAVSGRAGAGRLRATLACGAWAPCAPCRCSNTCAAAHERPLSVGALPGLRHSIARALQPHFSFQHRGELQRAQGSGRAEARQSRGRPGAAPAPGSHQAERARLAQRLSAGSSAPAREAPSCRRSRAGRCAAAS